MEGQFEVMGECRATIGRYREERRVCSEPATNLMTGIMGDGRMKGNDEPLLR